jgi:hypothetical protein
MDVHSSCKNPSMSSSYMNGTGSEKPRLVFKIKLPPAFNKEKKPCNVIKDREDEKPVPASSSGMNGVAKATDKSCLEKHQMDEELIELKLEATKRKLHQRYQQAQNGKRKIQLVDFKEIPKPKNVAKRPKGKGQYRW